MSNKFTISDLNILFRNETLFKNSELSSCSVCDLLLNEFLFCIATNNRMILDHQNNKKWFNLLLNEVDPNLPQNKITLEKSVRKINLKVNKE